ncbi:T9SS type A sorting domain-containing protein [Bacteroidota bacterium]
MSLKIFLMGFLYTFYSADNILSQNVWTKMYGGNRPDRFYSAKQTSDGGFIAAGNTFSFGAEGSDVFLVKTDSIGDTLWTRTYPGIDYENASSVQQTLDGGYIITGTTGGLESDILLIKTDSLGELSWLKRYGSQGQDWGNSVQQTTDEGYFIVGSTDSRTTDFKDFYLIKTDSDGDTLWTKTYGGESIDFGYYGQQTLDGGYIITGATISFGAGGADAWLLKTDSMGDTLWTRTYGGESADDASCVKQTIDGGYVLAGAKRPTSGDNVNVWLIKTDSIGNTHWTRMYGGIEDDLANYVSLTSDGGYIIAGRTGFSLNSNALLIKTDESGDTLWTKVYGGSDEDNFNSVEQTTDGGYIAAGTTESFGFGYSDGWLMKTDSIGNTKLELPTSVEEQEVIPIKNGLIQNYPNPFNPSTTIKFFVDKGAEVLLEVSDLSGQKLEVLVNEYKPAGSYEVGFDGSSYSSGVYIYNIKIGEYFYSEKMVLLK